MTAWMLLERTDELLPALFRTVALPEFVTLFDSTELARYSDFSPLLVKDDSDASLLSAMRAAPNDWPGLIIESEHNTEALLAHLRHLLIVRFEQTRKGMLRYWNPKVAGRLFPHCADLKPWLGPISHLAWHSDTGWTALDNPETAWQPPSPHQLLTLNTAQDQALSKQTSSGQES